MKQLILTGLATEHSFSNGGQEQYFLVFNNGETRIPVPQETAEAVVAELYGKSDPNVEQPRGFTAQEIEEAREQMIAERQAESTAWAGDDDGVDQI